MRSTRASSITLATTTLVGGLLVSGGASADETDATSQEEQQTLGDTSLQQTSIGAVNAKSSSASAAAEVEDAERDPFDLVGVTWAGAEAPADLSVQVRVRQDGSWTDWADLDVAAAGEDGTGRRGGTEPLWVGESDGVAARVTAPGGAVPDDLKVVTVDGGDAPAEAPTAPEASTKSAAPAQPSVITRGSWGASSGGTCDSPVYGKLRGVMIHHTAGSNSYSKSQSASIVRSIQSYHVGGQGWCDIGYNFLVDKYGQIFEGRKGGWTRMVRGAHAGNFEVNKSAVGISMMGNYDEAHTATAQRNAVVRLVAWRLGSKGLPAKGSPYKIGGETMQRISMHRDISATACPGRNAVNWVQNPGGLRDRVADAIS